MITTATIDILLVEDNLPDAQYVQEMLPAAVYAVNHAQNLGAAKKLLEDKSYSAILLDLSLPDGHGLATLLSMMGTTPSTAIIVLTGLDDEELAVQAVKFGAQDYVLKRDINENTLGRSIRYAMERKESEKSLHQSVVKAQAAALNLKLALNVSQTGVWLWYPNRDDGVCDDLTLSLIGRSPLPSGNALNSFLDCVHTDDRDMVMHALQEALHLKKEYDVEYRVVHDDGTVRHLAACGQCLYDEAGQPLHVIGLCRDVTKRRLEEENSKRLALLEQREEFMATISHDLKGPLIGANSVLESLARLEMGPLSNHQTEILLQLRNSNGALLLRVQNLVELYRYENGAQTIEFESVDIVALVREYVQELAPLAKISRIRLVAEAPEKVGHIWANESAIRRVLQNLVDNAMKFMPDGGDITLRLHETVNAVTLEVVDTGPGIPPDEQKSLFQRFAQGRIGKRYNPGTGLGLYLCKQIVEAHRGSISCQSTQGEGATFLVILPAMV
jgi:two-component system cell cycle sensor histidine kinase/response regulator CckA